MSNRFEDAKTKLLPIALSGVPSPYFTAAKELVKLGDLEHARKLLEIISKQHWQFDDALKFKDELFQREIDELKATIRNLQLEAVNTAYNALAQTRQGPSVESISLFNDVLNKLEDSRKLPTLEASSDALTYNFTQHLNNSRRVVEPVNPKRKERPLELEIEGTSTGPTSKTTH